MSIDPGIGKHANMIGGKIDDVKVIIGHVFRQVQGRIAHV